MPKAKAAFLLECIRLEEQPCPNRSNFHVRVHPITRAPMPKTMMAPNKSLCKMFKKTTCFSHPASNAPPPTPTPPCYRYHDCYCYCFFWVALRISSSGSSTSVLKALPARRQPYQILKTVPCNSGTLLCPVCF